MNTKHPFLTHAALFATAACLLRAHADQPIVTGQPEIISHRVHARVESAPTAGSTMASSPISYHGGALLATPTVYVIWYGNWNQNNGSDNSPGQGIVHDFLQNIGGSEYFKINSSYSTDSTTISGGVVSYGGEATDSGSQGKKLTDRKVQLIVQNMIQSGGLPADQNGVYFVLTSSDVSETSGFCNRYCGWHTHANMSGSGDIKYSFVGNAARCLSACAAQTKSPNGNPGVDAMISVIAHELEEATTDPDLNAWYDGGGAENADKCAWTFGTSIYDSVTGAYHNLQLGGRSYLIQRNLYHSASGDYCGLAVSSGTVLQAYPPAP